MERWCVAANFVGPRLFRWGANVRIVFSTGGDPARVRVRGLNFHGRHVEAWVRIGDLRSFRPAMAVRDYGDHATKAEAAVEAARYEWCRVLWGAKCPLLTWNQYRESLIASRAAAQ